MNKNDFRLQVLLRYQGRRPVEARLAIVAIEPGNDIKKCAEARFREMLQSGWKLSHHVIDWLATAPLGPRDVFVRRSLPRWIDTWADTNFGVRVFRP